MNKKLFTLLCVVAVSLTTVAAQTRPEGGTLLTMSHSVIAGGGGYSQWTQPDLQGRGGETVPNFEVEGTIGQAIAGTASTGGQYRVHQGFWFADEFQPTAAPASISGQVSSLGNRFHRTRVVLTDLSTGETRVANVNPFGFYRFDDLEVASLYLIEPEGQSLMFEPASLIVRLLDNVTGVDFTAHLIQ